MVVNDQSGTLNSSGLIQKAVIDRISTPNTTSEETTTNQISSESSSIYSWNLAYSLDNDLKTKSNEIDISFHNASEGVILTEYTSVSLSQQENILEDIQSKLLYIKNHETSDDEREAIRKNIITQLSELDTIATNSNYNEMYSLQKSSSSQDSSDIYSFRVSEVPAVTLNSISIQSNTIGLDLLDLKNIEEDKMTYHTSYDQIDNIKSALENISEFQKDYNNLQKTFKSSMSNLSNTYGNLKIEDNNLKDINYDLESILFDKNSILKQEGSMLQSQANTTQSKVIDLLS
ncbi:MAG: flagellin [Campylobacterota bacterium]|nr:flagellin [Campylobacterota bacterium]